MGFGVTTIFYLVIGAAVSVAVDLGQEPRKPGQRAFRAATALIFWPLYLPILLAKPQPGGRCVLPQPVAHQDEMAGTIAQVEDELNAAFSSLDGWAEGVLAREAERLGELRMVWTGQAARIREMDRLLVQVASAGAEAATHGGEATDSAGSTAMDGRRRQSEQARLANLARLQQVRNQGYEDLMGSLAWVRELVTMIHLAKFTGAPVTRAEELVGQIAAAVEGVSAVTWQADIAEPPEAAHDRLESDPAGLPRLAS